MQTSTLMGIQGSSKKLVNLYRYNKQTTRLVGISGSSKKLETW